MASLWIDFVLLPEKLEQHLVALGSGTVRGPQPPDLITMFLDQVLVNHKAALASAAPRDHDAQGTANGANWRMSKTTALLCERAARVAVASNFTLGDIESTIPSQQHQYLLLRALMEHDKSRLLLHECNLHRWRIHNALHSHFLGSSSASSSAARLGSWVIEEDLAELFNVLGSSSIGISTRPGGHGESAAEEESPSVYFLETVLNEDHNGIRAPEGIFEQTVALPQKEDAGDQTQNTDNGVSVQHQEVLNDEYRCQALFDIAEVHFMRGRIQRAHETFTKCGQLFVKVCSPRAQTESGTQQQVRLSTVAPVRQPSPVSKDRLSGFIIACRVLLAKEKSLGAQPGKEVSVGLDETPLPELGAPSPAQRAVIACEQSRWLAGSHLQRVQGATQLGRRCKRSAEEPDSGLSLAKRRKISPTNVLKRGQEQTGGEIESCLHPNMVDTKPVQPSNGFLGGNLLVHKGILSLREGTMDKVETWSPPRQIAGDIPADKQVGVADVVEEDPLCLRHNVSSKDKQSVTSVSDLPSVLACSDLVQTFADDLANGFLSWGYCLSVERDLDLPASVRCQLAACNVVRSVLEGAPVDSFLRVSEQFEHNRDGIEFLLNLVSKTRGIERKCPEKSLATGKCVRRRAAPPFAAKFLTPRREAVMHGVFDAKAVMERMDELALYICCVIDQPWCWSSAAAVGFTIPPGLTNLPGDKVLYQDSDGTGITDSNVASTSEAPGSCVSGGPRDPEIAKELLLFELAQGDSLSEIQATLCKVRALLGSNATVDRVPGERCAQCSLNQLKPEDDGEASHDADSGLCSPKKKDGNLVCPACGVSSSQNCQRVAASLATAVAAVLRQRAFDALENLKEVDVSRRLYEMAKDIDPSDYDSNLMLWLVDKLLRPKDLGLDKPSNGSLPGPNTGYFPSFFVLEYIILALVEHELWVQLTEFCQWGTTQLNEVSAPERSGLNVHAERQAGSESSGEGASVLRPVRYKKQLQTLKVTSALGDLMSLCVSIQTAASRNHVNEDASRLKTALWQLFEDFMCLLVGADIETQSQGGMESLSRGAQGGQMVMAALPPYPGARAVPLIPRVKNPRVLTSLASLTAGWLNRCHQAGLTPWSLACDRYGVLAQVTAGASLPPPIGSLPHAAAIFRSVPPRVTPGFGRDLFRVVLESIVALPEVIEGDKEGGHRWLQGLADLAYEDEAYVKALQLYLQAGAIRSAHYCDHASASMPRDVFTIWVIRRMMNACRAIGAGLQAAILCQCLPQPDYESAFRFLQENSPILDRDAADYFQCIWEVPILELLVHLHERAGDEARVNTLIGYLQHPAMNVHNPQSIRKAHITALEQRFLQRLSEELL